MTDPKNSNCTLSQKLPGNFTGTLCVDFDINSDEELQKEPAEEELLFGGTKAEFIREMVI